MAEALAGDHVDLSAEDVLQKARTRVPEVSLATVYNALNQLLDLGEVRTVRAADGATRYDPNPRDHHHLCCDACGTLFDVIPEGLNQLVLSSSERRGFRVTAVEVTFRGRCPACDSGRH